jgi:FKBP-type peptidyl-prolyl cis-trans isomerase 2
LGGTIARKAKHKKEKRAKKQGVNVSADLFKDKRVLLAIVAVVVIVLVGWRVSTFTIPAGTTGDTDVVTQEGSGDEIATGDLVLVEYTGTLEDGEEFDSGEVDFIIGAGQMIVGFEEAVIGMMQDGEKTFTIPAAKAYGEHDPTKTQELPVKRTVNKTVEITLDDFAQALGEDPVEGETYTTEATTWPIKVLSVSGDNVEIEYMPTEGDTLDYDYGFETIHIAGDTLEITLTPTIGSEIMTMYGSIKITDADEDSMTVDFNHPLAGKPLTFAIKILEVTKADSVSDAPAAEAVAGDDVCSNLGITKSARPSVELFIMSYCPYGLQMQKAMLPVMDLLGDSADFRIKWVSYIMHSEKEIDENNVQECIQVAYPDAYIDYATCFTVTGETDSCMTTAGIDRATVDSCIAALDADFNITGLYEDTSTWSGGRYPPYMVHIMENTQYGIRGSPTTVINGDVVGINRSPEDVKQAVCCAFTNPPAECDQVLSSAPASPGIGGGTGSSSTAECG